MRIEKRLLRFITLTNWIIFCIVTTSGFILVPGPFAWGILAGGLIVTINFQLMYRSLKSALTPPHVANIRVVLGKYYLRFLASALIIYVLIADHYVNPLGLIIGLSVVVTSIFIATVNEIRRIIFKEAA
ncbi:MAG: ATP synthase subunit I [Desulfobacterales bacterium]|nr:ATP synthase subunit I [Desulfobacterales bacterium]